MISIKEKKKSVVVKFDPASKLRDAPKKKFRRELYGDDGAVQFANRYADGVREMSNHSKNISSVIRSSPILSMGKIGFHVDNVTNRTGVVGVYLAKNNAGKPIGYIANWCVNGERHRQLFPFSQFPAEEAYRQACATRLAVLNMNVVMLDR